MPVSRGFMSAVALGLSVVLVSAAHAQDQPDTNGRQTRGQAAQGQQSSREMQSTDGLPKAIQQLDLQDEQKQQIEQILRGNQEEFQQAWTQFHKKHMQAVAIEAAMVASLEKQLSESQRDQFRQGRDNASANGQPWNDRNGEQQQDQPFSQDSRDGQSQRDRNQAPRDRSQSSPDRQQQATGQRQAELNQQARRGDAGALFVAIIRPVQSGLDQAGLTESQKSECEACSSKYSQKLQQLWGEIHQLHTEMVQIEAEKMTQVAEVLSEDQLQQLEKHLQEEGSQQATTATRQQRDRQQDRQ